MKQRVAILLTTAAAWIGLCVTRSVSQENLPVSRPLYGVHPLALRFHR